METGKRGYIARKYGVEKSIYFAATYFEEGLFSSYDSAYNFIKEISDEDEFDNFLSEIVSYKIDDHESWETSQVWRFDKAGNLIRTYDEQQPYENYHVVDLGDGVKELYREPEPGNYTGIFKVGDIVFVRARPWNEYSGACVDVIGVVGDTPIPYAEWAQDGEKYGWDDNYTIFCINRGYLDHIHVIEKGIEKYAQRVPENLVFLEQLSDHFTGKRKIRAEILDEILSGKIFVEKVRHVTDEDLFE